MKRNEEQALRWFDQAVHDFEVAKSNFNAGFYSDACFMCEQAAQKALKAYIIYQGRRYVWERSIQELARFSTEYEKEFEKIIEAGMILDRYYITTRYPNALAPPATPYKSYTEKDASEAKSLAEEIVEMVRNKLGWVSHG